MNNSNIFILSRPVQTGKTSLLQHWLKTEKNADGVLTPDVDGYRRLLDIASGNNYTLQLRENDQGLKIGRFVFDETVFQKGNDILLDTFNKDHDWTVVDEVGKLEMFQGRGLEPAVSKLITYFQSSQTNKKLLLIIRDYLLDEAIAHYKLQDAKLLQVSFFKREPVHPLNGVVLCGGESSRMKTDKAFLNYHDKPQYQQVREMLSHFCGNTFLSINARQSSFIDNNAEKILDNPSYVDAGPLTGLLSMIESHPEKSLFIVGCDYPFLKKIDLLQLFNERDDASDVVCFKNESGFAEPLIAIYEQQCFEKLHSYYAGGGRSLQQFLKQINTKFMSPKEAKSLTSIDTVEDYATIKNGGS
jgi:molybdopterin-guanine dinucleotide biosynthesis protein A/nucleoside-triphosphatase THEP1